MKELADLRDEAGRMDAVLRALTDAREMLELFAGDPSVDGEVDTNLAQATVVLDELEMAANFDGEYDSHGARDRKSVV